MDICSDSDLFATVLTETTDSTMEIEYHLQLLSNNIHFLRVDCHIEEVFTTKVNLHVSAGLIFKYN